MVSATRQQAGVYQLTSDRNIDNCSAQVSSDFAARFRSVITTGSTSTVYVYSHSGTLINYYFNTVVNC